MPTHRRWADLHAGLVSRVADLCALQGYASCRAVCASWRAALPPPTSRPLAPVVVPADDGCGDTASHEPLSLAVCSVHAQRWSRLLGLRQPSGLANATGASRCVGARDGWVVLAAANAKAGAASVVLLFNPLTGVEIPLHASLYDPKCESPPKVVFSPCPTVRDFAAVSICRRNRLAVQRTTDGYSSSLVLDTAALMDGADLADVAFDDNGRVVYCLMRHGAVHVLRLNRRRHRGRLRPIEIEPLVTGGSTDAVFPAPYDTIARFTEAKNLVLCDGALYQVWRRPSGAGSAVVPAGIYDQQLLRIPESAVFVLRYEPAPPAGGSRPPCWSESKDLGGHAVFLGANDAAAVRGHDGDGAAELMSGGCLYYWASRAEGDYEAFAYSMADRISTRLPPATGGVSSPLWYFLPAGAANVEATTAMEAASDEVSVAVTV
uniref:KIB1-4 beta-propeller domain-containing protein n=1 Tax=Oryza punctata TaxID=4537 RepID=A0A0E0KRV4_ORYPU